MTAIALYGYNSSLSYLTPLLCRCHLGESISHDVVFQRIVPRWITSSSSLLLSYYQRGSSFVGFIFICIDTGGIKPCVSSFDADQLIGLSSSSAAKQKTHRIRNDTIRWRDTTATTTHRDTTLLLRIQSWNHELSEKERQKPLEMNDDYDDTDGWMNESGTNSFNRILWLFKHWQMVRL